MKKSLLAAALLVGFELEFLFKCCYRFGCLSYCSGERKLKRAMVYYYCSRGFVQSEFGGIFVKCCHQFRARKGAISPIYLVQCG